MKRKFDLNKFKKLHALSKHELHCIKGGKGNRGNDTGTGAGCPPPPPRD